MILFDIICYVALERKSNGRTNTYGKQKQNTNRQKAPGADLRESPGYQLTHS
jgi:hypothetical protein